VGLDFWKVMGTTLQQEEGWGKRKGFPTQALQKKSFSNKVFFFLQF